MAVSFYLDEHIPRAITNGLRLRGINVLTVQEDGRAGVSDADLLDRATELGRILVTFDDDLLAEAAMRQRNGEYFSGVIYGHPLSLPIGVAVNDLEVIAKVLEPAEAKGQVIFLPL